VLRDGRIAQYSAPAELYSRPVDSGLARFVGDANLLDGVRHDGLVDTVLGQLPVELADGDAGPQSRLVTVLIRPEHIELLAADHTEADSPGPGPGPVGRIIESEYYGHDAVLRVKLEQTDNEPIVVRTTGDHQLPTGSLVTLRARGPVLTWPR